MRSESAELLIHFTPTENCPACGERGPARSLYRLEKFSVRRCRCGHYFIDPSLDGASQMRIYQSSKALEQINPACSAYYEYNTLDPDSATFRDYEKSLGEIEAHVQGRRMLEVGCGSGSFLTAAKSRGWDVTGVDSGRDNIKLLNDKGIRGLCSGFLEMDSPEKYDCIVMRDLIEHPQKPEEFVLKCRALLNPGGGIHLALPRYPNLLSVTAGLLHRLSFGRICGPLKKMYGAEHTSYFNERTLGRLLSRCCFTVIKSWAEETDLERYVFSWPARVVLKSAFMIARATGTQNRLNVIAQTL
ncbi:MAG: hypothetical protein A2Z83_07715 [Omnitrophica bacterium GWA2_52_8]|nr:MAG: hypothetical protein A2Z83_07715 [Omnitrophica bacterium GWA2_52_8]